MIADQDGNKVPAGEFAKTVMAEVLNVNLNNWESILKELDYEIDDITPGEKKRIEEQLQKLTDRVFKMLKREFEPLGGEKDSDDEDEVEDDDLEEDAKGRVSEDEDDDSDSEDEEEEGEEDEDDDSDSEDEEEEDEPVKKKAVKKVEKTKTKKKAVVKKKTVAKKKTVKKKGK